MIEAKACTECGEVKSLPAFHTDKRRKDGRRAKCADCTRAKLRDAYAADPDKQKDKVRERYWEAPEEHRERKRTAYGRIARIRASQRRYNLRNRDARNAASQLWRDANREHLATYYQEDAQRRKGYQREWRRANPERVREYRQRHAPQAHDYLTQWRRTQRTDAGVHADTQAP